MLFYFTATGNSLYVAKQLEGQPISIAQAVHDSSKVYTADKIGIVSPVFGHEVPALVKEFLEKAVFETPYFYMILTYGNRHGGAVELAEKMPADAFSNLYRITEECIGCEICTKICPKNCFTVKKQKSTWHPEGCITCMACIHACPMKAIQMNMPEKNPHARYRNENISLCEIIDANNQLD